MTIPERSCGFCRRLLATTIPVQQRTLPEEGYDAASYLVGYGGSGHAYALYLQTLRFTCFEVVDMRSFFSFQEVVYLLKYHDVVYFLNK